MRNFFAGTAYLLRVGLSSTVLAFARAAEMRETAGFFASHERTHGVTLMGSTRGELFFVRLQFGHSCAQ
jgi:hypothetical protein